jgi:hypothetical protein
LPILIGLLPEHRQFFYKRQVSIDDVRRFVRPEAATEDVLVAKFIAQVTEVYRLAVFAIRLFELDVRQVFEATGSKWLNLLNASVLMV